MHLFPKKQAKDKKNCKKCDIELTSKNWYMYGGLVYPNCKPCRKKYIQKLNRERYKKIKESKWF